MKCTPNWRDYTYDSWGKLISTTGSLASTVGVKNPYRYRGYRYDTETGLYYLQSRYYNAEWGRFINADGIVATPGQLLSGNMFAYCTNDPINRIDPNGNLGFLAALGLAVGGTAFGVAAVVFFAAAAIILTAIVIYEIYDRLNADSEDDAGSSSESSSSSQETSSSGRSKNKLRPDPKAEGPHSTLKRDPNTGEVSNYRTWRPNPRSPRKFDETKGYDGKGRPHTNTRTGEDLMPHVHGPNIPGGVRKPIPWEIPSKPL